LTLFSILKYFYFLLILKFEFLSFKIKLILIFFDFKPSKLNFSGLLNKLTEIKKI
jgi:hypothetical protein